MVLKQLMLMHYQTMQGSDTRHEIQRMHIEPDRKGWAGLVDMYRVYDESRIKDAKEDVDTLLVFVRTFLCLSVPQFLMFAGFHRPAYSQQCYRHL